MKAQASDFDAVLYPNRALSQRGNLILGAFLMLSVLYVGFLFYSKGAWPILGFCTLEIGIIFWVLYLHYRASYRREHIRLENAHLVIEDHPYKKTPKKWFLPRGRIRVQEDAHRKCVIIRSDEMAVHVGQCLSTDERREFMAALRKALHHY